MYSHFGVVADGDCCGQAYPGDICHIDPGGVVLKYIVGIHKGGSYTTAIETIVGVILDGGVSQLHRAARSVNAISIVPDSGVGNRDCA